MRLLEIALVALLAVGLIGWMVGGRWTRARGYAALVALVLAAHLVVEGIRLPMTVAYLVAVIMVSRALFRRETAVRRGGPLRLAARFAVGLVALVLLIAPPWLFPIFELPAPRGPFAVGGTAFAVTDSTREDPFAPHDQKGLRTFPVRVWYPARPGTRGPRVRYAATLELASPVVKLLHPALAHQYRYVETHTVAEAPLASQVEPFPLLVFSHGYSGYSSQNTPQMEELASRGYVVMSIAHTYDATAAVFPDGRTVRLDPGLVEAMSSLSRNPDSMMKVATERLAALERAGTPVDRRARFLDFVRGNPERITRSYPVWAADTRALLDYLERGVTAGPLDRFAGKLDLARIGIFGMSFGGSNAGEVCRVDPRCKAGLNIDGQQFGPLIDDSLTVPFMIIASETAAPIHLAIMDRLRGPGYLLRLEGSQHAGLMDLPYLSPFLFSKIGLSGTMPIGRVQQVLNDYIGAFFDTYLKGEPSDLLTRSDPAPDLEFRVVNR